jgi:signal transduction histidine kinase
LRLSASQLSFSVRTEQPWFFPVDFDFHIVQGDSITYHIHKFNPQHIHDHASLITHRSHKEKAMSTQVTTVDPQKLAHLVEISRVLNSATSVDKLLHYIIKKAADLTDSEAASILLLDPQTRQLHFKAASNKSQSASMSNIPVPLDNSIAGAVLQSNHPLLIRDVTQDPRWNADVSQSIQFETKNILGVPMHDVERQPMGVLEALNKQQGEFTREDAETMTILADIAGVAVERARMTEALQQAYEALNSLDQLKTDFIAVASHELRTPLSVIMGYVSFLREEANPATADQLDHVMSAAVHLRDLIQGMLNLRYVDTGKAALHLEPTDFVAFVREITAVAQETAAAKHQSLTTHLPANKLLVQLDRSILEVALNNLINNAVKFTPEGGQLTIGVEKQGREAWFIIQDNGPGIPADKLDRIFNRFYQLEPALTRKHGGLGLGLSIAKDLVKLHYGRLWAESTEYKGSTFFVALPLAELF